MKKMLIILLSTLALGAVMTSGSNAYAWSGSYTGTVTKMGMQAVGADNYFWLKFPSYPTYTPLPGYCITDGNYSVILLFPDDDRGKSMIALVLAAYLSGKPISASFGDGNATSWTSCRVSSVSAA